MKKKHIYLFVLLSFIVLFMTNVQNTLEVYAEPESYTGDKVLLNDNSAHVNISYRIESQIVKWSITYKKYGNEPQQQLKIAVSPLSGFAALHGLDQLTTEGDWLLLSDYDDALTGKISFETSIAIGEMDGEYGLSVSVQRSLRQETAGESTAEIDVLDGTPQQILVAEDYLALLLSGQNNDSATTSSSGIEESSSTQSTATTESDNETSEDSSSDESLLNNQSIKPRVDTSGGQGSFVVSDKIFNDPEDMDIEVTAKTLPVPQHTITLKDKNTTRKDYDSDSDNLNYVYSNYLDGLGKVNIQFEEIATQSYLSNVTVTVRYPHVGFIIDQSGELIPIGVTLTIDNIQRSPSPTTWTGYPFAKPSIDLSTNLYSGMVLNGISAADFSFVFTESDGTEVDFSQLTNPFMTFSL